MERLQNETDVEFLQRYRNELGRPDIYVIFIEGHEQYVENFVYWTFSEKEAQKICGRHPDLCYDIVPGNIIQTDKKVYSKRTSETALGTLREIRTKAATPYKELLKALDPDEPDYILANSLEEAENYFRDREQRK